MPILTTTIEDTSPLIVYSGINGSDWVAGTSALDKYVDQYSQSSFMVTQTARADMTFFFYGTGLQLYGAKRPNHGQFQVSIDSKVYLPVNGSAPDPGNFQTSLFNAVALENGYHTVRLTNVESSYLDLDFITWQTPIGQTDDVLIATTVQDTDPSFKYTPEDQWNPSPANAGVFFGGSGHVTATPGASVEFTFKGDSVALYGPVGPTGSPYSVQLDNSAAQNFSANKQFYRSQTMLFQASNLGVGQHTVKLRLEARNNSALALAIDYAEVYTTASSLQKSAGLSTGAIAGIAICSVLLALLAFIVIFRRLWPSNFKKIFRLKGKSSENQFVTKAFEYHPIGVNGSTSRDTSSQKSVTTHSHGLTTQSSPSIFNPTPPSTSLWPNSGEGSYAAPVDAQLLGPNTQVVTLPFTADGKYRPDLVPAPQLMPPPQGLRRTTAQALSTQQSPSMTLHTSRYQALRSNRSQPSFATALPPGARQPVPAVSLDNMRGVVRNDEVQEGVLAPVRRQVNVTFEGPSPPQYERDP